MKLIVPCCGRSSRYPNQPPKWMLPAHDGRPMLALAVSKLEYRREDLIVTILREHEEKYHATHGLKEALGDELRVLVLDTPTQSQVETVARTIEAAHLDEPILIKDSDNIFALAEIDQPYNYISVDSLNNYDSINPRNKSYLQVDHNWVVTNIREKVVISDLFSVGGYYFTDPAQFLEFYHRLSANKASWQCELYISDVIGAMILEGIPFRARSITAYQDWGTISEWRNTLEARKAFFVLLDGFVFERGSEFFHPRYSEVKPNAQAVEAVRAIQQQGHAVFYLSIRPSQLAELTGQQLTAAGLESSKVIYDCPIAAWTLLTAPHPTIPFHTSSALEIRPDEANLVERVLGKD